MFVHVNVSAYLFMSVKERNINYKIQTHKRYKGTLFIRTKTQSANFGGNPLGVIPCIKLQNNT